MHQICVTVTMLNLGKKKKIEGNQCFDVYLHLIHHYHGLNNVLGVLHFLQTVHENSAAL